MTYHGGGLYTGSRPLKIRVTRMGLYYGPYFIPKERIKSFDLDNKAQKKNKQREDLPVLGLLLTGLLSSLVTNEGLSNLNSTANKLNVHYTENSESYTLLLEGNSATEVYNVLNQIKDY